MSAEDATVPAAVAEAAPSIVGAIDAIAEPARARRPADLRRRGHVGPAGRARRRRVRVDILLAPGQVVALLAGGDRDARPSRRPRRTTRRRARGRRRARASAPTTRWSASAPAAARRTSLGGLEAARAAGALTACVVSVDGSRARAPGRARDRRRRRPRDPRRLDPAQGRDRAEARTQHALDDRR